MNEPNYWQIAAGDNSRNYVDVCLDYGVVLMGPGDYGAWIDETAEKMRSDGWSERKITNLRRFCTEIRAGDIIALRLGGFCLYGVGIVQPLTEINAVCGHLDIFGDIDGWDIQHFWPVKWIWDYRETGKEKEFERYTIKVGDTVQFLHNDKGQKNSARDFVDECLGNPRHRKASLNATDFYNFSYEQISEDDLERSLVEKNFSRENAKKIAGRIGELAELTHWYDTHEWPSEAETIAHITIPLLLVLGWAPKCTALEWKNVDIALFDSTERKSETLSAVVEAKKLNHSCLSAFGQAKNYIEEKGKDKCQRLIVTDGRRYAVFLRNPDGDFDKSPSAYLNLTKMRSAYPIYGECKGATEAILMMSKHWC